MVDFWASWCGRVRCWPPTVDKLAEKYDGKVIVGKVDVDEDRSWPAVRRYEHPHRGALQGRQGGQRTVGVAAPGSL